MYLILSWCIYEFINELPPCPRPIVRTDYGHLLRCVDWSGYNFTPTIMSNNPWIFKCNLQILQATRRAVAPVRATRSCYALTRSCLWSPIILYVCICMYMYIYIYIYVFMHISLSLYIYIYTYFYISINITRAQRTNYIMLCDLPHCPSRRIRRCCYSGPDVPRVRNTRARCQYRRCLLDLHVLYIG